MFEMQVHDRIWPMPMMLHPMAVATMFVSASELPEPPQADKLAIIASVIRFLVIIIIPCY